jgi:hypothetical protein
LTIEQVVADRLAADGAIAAIVGFRVYQLRLPQSPTYPAILVQLIDEPTTSHLRGVTNLYRARIQIDSFVDETSGGDPYLTVSELAQAVDAALIGAPWTLGSPQMIDVLFVERQSRRTIYEPDELTLDRMMQDYFVFYRTV